MPHDNAAFDDNGRFDGDSASETVSTSKPTSTPTVVATKTEADADGESAALPNTVTVIGRGAPSSFEITVDGEIAIGDESASSEAPIVSGSTVEGTVETDTVRFQFTGDLTDVTFVDHGITGLSPANAPSVHVDYGTFGPSRSQS